MTLSEGISLLLSLTLFQRYKLLQNLIYGILVYGELHNAVDTDTIEVLSIIRIYDHLCIFFVLMEGKLCHRLISLHGSLRINISTRCQITDDTIGCGKFICIHFFPSLVTV